MKEKEENDDEFADLSEDSRIHRKAQRLAHRLE